MTDILCELLSIKDCYYEKTLQNKETVVQSCRKMSKQNTKKNHGIEGALLAARWR